MGDPTGRPYVVRFDIQFNRPSGSPYEEKTMTNNPEEHHRRSIRLKGYDYSQAGAYFITICAHKKKCILGDEKDGKVTLNEIGQMVQKTWIELPIYYVGVDIDEFIIMPNHLHGIIILKVGAGPRACPGDEGQPQGVAPTMILSLPDVVHRFKSLTTKRYIEGVKQDNWKPFERHFWQRNYYEHIIRNEDKLNRIREYIINNPLQWQFDRENPGHIRDEAYENQWGHLERVIYRDLCKKAM